jgi:hypothetical protein
MASETTRFLRPREIEKEGSNIRRSGLSDETIDQGSEADIDVQEEDITQFLPETNIQFAWDATTLSDFKRCPKLYEYLYIDGWRQKEESVHLRFGAEYHRALQDYDKLRVEGIKHDEAVFHVVKGLVYRTEDWNPDHKYKNRDFLVRTAIWYLEEHKDDAAKVHILSNGKPAVELSFNFELDWGFPDQPYVLCGHLDKIVDFGGEMFVMDHKTTTTTPGDYYFDQFEPDNQMTLYTLAGRVVYEMPVRGVIINAAQIMIDSTRFVRGMTYRTPDQLEEWVQDLHHWFDLAHKYAEREYWPMNDTACDKYGGCKFRNICSKSPSVRHRFLEANFEKGEPWNPLKVRD